MSEAPNEQAPQEPEKIQWFREIFRRTFRLFPPSWVEYGGIAFLLPLWIAISYLLGKPEGDPIAWIFFWLPAFLWNVIFVGSFFLLWGATIVIRFLVWIWLRVQNST